MKREGILVRAFYFEAGNLVECTIEVSQNNYILVRKKLESVYKEIVDILKNYKREKIIKSIFRPKNKKIQKELDEFVKVKKEIKASVDKIKTYFR